MANTLGVDICHTSQNLSHELLDGVHGDYVVLLLGILDHLLKVLLTELKDKVLHYLALFVL